MAKICMDYIIIIKKEYHDLQFMIHLIREYLDKAKYERDDKYFYIGDDRIEYEIKYKRNSNRIFLSMISTLRFNKGVNSLQKLDDTLFKTDFQKYADVIRAYDGCSEAVSEKLFSKYAQYERRLRQLIILVMTKAFGETWREKTISKEEFDKLKGKNKGRTVSLTDTLELFDLQQMEDFLFEPREVDYHVYLEKKLSINLIDSLSKEEIIRIVNGMRPMSLWDRYFHDIGDGDGWKRQIIEIHDCRNKVAHHKHISVDEYKMTNSRLNRINKQLSNSIEEIYRRDFTDINAINLLGSFALFINSISESIAKTVFSGLLNQINKSIQQMVEPIKKSNLNIVDTFKQVKERMELISQPIFDENISEKRKLLSQTYQNINDEYIKKQMEIEAIEIADRVGKMVNDSE